MKRKTFEESHARVRRVALTLEFRRQSAIKKSPFASESKNPTTTWLLPNPGSRRAMHFSRGLECINHFF